MSNQTNGAKESGFVFRVLNGSLNGIEFSLGPHDYFICVGDAGAQQGNLAFADRTLYLPGAPSSNNFIVNLTNRIDENVFDVTICLPDQQQPRRLALNQVCDVEGIYFSLKHENDSWSEEVKKGVPSLAVATLQSEEIPVAEAKIRGSKTWKSKSTVLFLILLLLIGGACAAGWKTIFDASKVEVTKLHDVVGDRPGYALQLGRNDVYYLFASGAQEAEWVQQALQRKNLTSMWRIITPQAEEVRLTSLLERNNVAFFAIRFTNPDSPTLLMSSTRNSTDDGNLNHVMQLMLAEMRYANKINIILQDDNELLNKAQQGLKALGFDYQTTQSDSGVTLLSGLPSVDVHLSEFSRFVTQFYQSWGRRYIHFSADVRDDVLKDKSYKYGDDGYISMSRSHWLFNKKMD